MSRNVLVFTVAALALGLAACNEAQSPTAAAPPMAVGGSGGDGSAGATAASPLLGNWKLVSLQQAGKPAQPAPAGALFSADFAADGRLSSVVDCNRCAGGYTAGAESLSVGAMACTRAYCFETAPFDSTFETMLSSAQGWRVQGSSLQVSCEGGSMTFAR